MQVVPSFTSVNDDLAVDGIPGLNTRAVATTVDLREGQWLAVAGLIQERIEKIPEHWKIVGFQAVAGTDVQHVASVEMRGPNGGVQKEAACGDGPVDAVFKAIQRTTGIHARLQDYQVRSVTVGKDAQGEVNVEAQFDGRVFRGRAVSTDVITASAQAYVGLINRIVAEVGEVSDTGATVAAAVAVARSS